jgi:hypothetical protein
LLELFHQNIEACEESGVRAVGRQRVQQSFNAVLSDAFWLAEKRGRFR